MRGVLVLGKRGEWRGGGGQVRRSVGSACGGLEYLSQGVSEQKGQRGGSVLKVN